MGSPEPIAIIGMAGRFPGAGGIEEYWSNLVMGLDCLTEIPDDELLRWGELRETIDTPGYVRRRPVLTDAAAFDAGLFGMTPKEAEIHDPQYRLMLETVHAVLEHAGYDPTSFPGAIALYAGTNANRYRYDYIEPRQDIMRQTGYLSIDIANHPDYMSTFISYKLGLRGPSATLLTACSTSLVALHTACNSLRAGDCDMAIAGGVDIEFPHHRGYVYADGGIHARDGWPRAFDAEATGTNFGDGVGAVLLKPLSAAIHDRDSVHAVVLGSAINNDGNRKVGFTAPSVAGQGECVAAALRAARVDPASISYVEAHGTGTQIGDPIEMMGLIAAYRSVASGDLPPKHFGIGSVKSNIGHLGQASGIAGLIKTALALERELIPPSIHVTTPNPHVDWDDSPFAIVTEPQPWPRTPDGPRRAAVSSFGIGGTNAHVVLEEAPAAPAAAAARREVEAVLYSAAEPAAVERLRERLADHFRTLPDGEPFADTAHTLRVGRTPRAVRGAVLATGSADAARALADSRRVITSDGTARRLIFAFPGQGAQRPGLYRRLYTAEPLFARRCDAAFGLLGEELDDDIGALWRNGTRPAEIVATHIAQPLLFVLESTLAHCLISWGAEPDALLGHSLGELVAAAVGGVLDFESGLRAMALRSRAMRRIEPGRMLAVDAGADDVADLCGAVVALAAVNGPRRVVLSGPSDEIDRVEAVLADRGVPATALRTSHAFHSPMMAAAAEEFAAGLKELELRPPRIPIVSAATGAPLSADEATSAGFWAGQLVAPVLFDTAAGRALADGPATVVEVGPGRGLSTLLRSRPGSRADHRFLGTDEDDDQGGGLEETLARLWVSGVPITYWHQDAAERGYRRVAAPGYPYQRRIYWMDPVGPDETSPAPARTGAAPKTAPLPPADLSEPAEPAPAWRTGRHEWHPAPRASDGEPAARAETAVVVLPDSDAATGIAVAFKRAGHQVLHARRGHDLDTTDPAGWAALLDRASNAHGDPTLIAYCGLLDTPATVTGGTVEAQLDAGTGSVAAALKAVAAAQRRIRAPVRFVVVGRGMADVTGSEPVNPAAAMVRGMLRSAARELPGVEVRTVDVGERVAEHVLAAEFARLTDDLVALRGTTRWLPAVRETPPVPSAGTPVRHRGTYLVTGGLGGLGLITARVLADTGLRPRIGLLGRSGMAPRGTAAGAAARAALEELAVAGADVLVLSGDVADRASLTEAVERLERRFGPVNGVVHSAGVAGGGLLERRDVEQMRQVLIPKVHGVLALEDVFADRPELDFLILYSSQAAALGLYGSADYAAANAFLDAHALSATGRERLTVSIQWPGWSTVGMAAASDVPLATLTEGTAGTGAVPAAPVNEPGGTVGATREYVPGESWEFIEHVFDGVQVLPGTALLDLVVTAARSAEVAPPGSALELQDTVLLSPVVGDRTRTVRVLLNRVADTHRFRVQSSGGNGWTEHANGVLAAVPGEIAERERIRDGGGRSGADDPDTADGPDSADAPQTSDLASWLEYGPRWQMARPGTGTATERVIPLELPAEFAADLDTYPLHPAILDVAAGVLTDVEPDKAYAPFMYHRLLFVAPLTSAVTVRTRLRENARRSPRPTDFEIYDTHTGSLLVAVEAFTMREVPKGFGRGPAEPRPESRGSTGRDDTRAGMLSPQAGAEALRHILAGPPSPLVLVEASGQEGSLLSPRPDRPGQRTPVPAPVRAAATASTDAVTAALRGLWTEALGVPEIGLDDDFFEIGGTSLLAVTLISRINKRFGVALGAGALFDTGTIAGLATEIATLAETG